MTELSGITSVSGVTSAVSQASPGVATRLLTLAESGQEAVVDTIELSANGASSSSAAEGSGAVSEATATKTGIVVEALKIIADQQQYAADLLASFAEQARQTVESGKGGVLDTVA